MTISFDAYTITKIQEKDAWPLCDFMISNTDRFKDYFPLTLKENLTPTLSEIFVQKKVKEFHLKQEFLFTIKKNTNKNIVGLVYVKELHKKQGQGEFAYCIGYPYTGKGIMSKAIQQLIPWCFKEAALDTLQIIVHNSNKASIKVAEKNSFNWIQTLPKEHQVANGEYLDMELYELYNKK